MFYVKGILTMKLVEKHYERKTARSPWGKPVKVNYIDNYSEELYYRRITSKEACNFFRNLGGKEYNLSGLHYSVRPDGLERTVYELVND